MKIISVSGNDTLEGTHCGKDVQLEIIEGGNEGIIFGESLIIPRVEFAKLARYLLGDVELNDDLINKLER